MRIEWEDHAFADLEAIVERAPRQAKRVFEAIDALAASPFPGMFRRRQGHDPEHLLTVVWTPYLVIYRLLREQSVLSIVRVLDGRRQRTPL